MEVNTAFKNHLMFEELRQNKQTLFDKQIGRIRGNPIGYETPLGHTYSLVLERMAIEGLNTTPEVEEFLSFISERQEWDQKNVTLKTRTYYPSILNPVIGYMRKQNISEDGVNKVIRGIVGPFG